MTRVHPTEADAMLMYPNPANQQLDAAKAARMARFFWIFLTLTSLPPITASGTPETDGLDYLNSLRASAGMTALTMRSELATAADNHSNFQFLNNVFSHHEFSSGQGFTGVTAADRAVYAGYLSTSISENISFGSGPTFDTYEAIDGLMSAIYHRFTFLQVDVDDIGIGIRNGFYTYNLGNSLLNSLCGGTSYSGNGYYYYNVCADSNFRTAKSDYEGATAQIANSNPAIVLWPAGNARDIPPVFFEESPDPLPNHSVSGYPVSVEFNAVRTTGTVAVQNLAVFDDTDTELPYAHRVLQPADDSNNRFSPYQVAAFPLHRLAWGKTYRAQIDYTLDGAPQSFYWRFTTRGLPNPYYQVDGQAVATFNVLPGETYSIYFAPRDADDTLGGYGYSFSGGMTVDSSYVDQNTINVRVTGSIGQQATFNFSNGQRLILTLAATDSAMDNTVSPDTDVDGLNDDIDNCPTAANKDQLDTDDDNQGDICDSDDDADGLSDEDETTSHGTDPLKADTDDDGMDDRYEVDNGLNPLVDDAASDKDNDGISNLQEYLDGSNPSDPNDPVSGLPATELLQIILPLLLE